MAGMQFVDRVNDITYQKILPRVTDQINNSNIFASILLNKPGEWGGGPYITAPIMIANSQTGGSFSGLDIAPTAPTNNTRHLRWAPSAFRQTITYPDLDRVVNANKMAGAISLVSNLMDQARISASQSLGQIFYGNGAGKDFDGLGAIIDNGSNTASYGGLSRSQYPMLNADITPVNAGTLSLNYMALEYDNISAGSSGSESPTFIITSKNGWSIVEQLLHPQVTNFYNGSQIRAFDANRGGVPAAQVSDQRLTALAGFNSIEYRATPVYKDDLADDGSMYFINFNYMKFKRLIDPELKQIEGDVKTIRGFYGGAPEGDGEGGRGGVKFPSVWQFRPWMSPVNQNGKVAMLMAFGQFICEQPRRNGKLTGITNA